jgi:L-fuconolactonase
VILDAHHHLWDPARHAFAWMTAAPALRRVFDTADLAAVARPCGVTATVVVQADPSEAETRDLLAIAAADDLVRGVVGWVDLTRRDVGDCIARLRELPGGDRLIGLRHPVQDEPDPEWLVRADVARGLRAVADAGLAFDLLVRPPQLAAARRAVAAVPELRVVVDHGAKPSIAAGGSDAWCRDLAALAADERVHCKLSGLVTEADHVRWRRQDVGRYADTLLELFGPQRLMFGSDWPVCTLAATYGEVLDMARAAIAELSGAERDAVLRGTAARFYGLEGGTAE